MAFGDFVQSIQQSDLAGADSVEVLSSVLWGSNVTTGNSILVYLRTSTNTVTVTSITDDLSNTYVQDETSLDASSFCSVFLWRASNITGGAKPAITINLSGNATVRAAALELVGNFVLDKKAKATGTSATTLDSGATATTTVANELIFGVGLTTADTSWTAGASFTLREVVPLTAAGRVAGESRQVSSVGTYSATFTIADVDDWACIVASYYAAAGPAVSKVTGRGQLIGSKRGQLAIHP